MKNSLISIVLVAIVVLISSVRQASADSIYETKHAVVKVTISGPNGWRKTFKSETPVTILRKTCADDGHRNCFFLVKGSKQTEIKYLRYTDSDKYTDGYDYQVVYVTRTTYQTY